VGKYLDDNSAQQIGERIRKYRKEKGHSMDDVSQMTGLSVNTLSSIENGGNTYVSHCIAICQALELKPSELFDIQIELKPRYELPPSRKNRALTTFRVNSLLETGFFGTPRFVESVVEELAVNYGVQVDSSEISTALKKLNEDGKLTFSKSGRRNLYVMRED